MGVSLCGLVWVGVCVGGCLDEWMDGCACLCGWVYVGVGWVGVYVLASCTVRCVSRCRILWVTFAVDLCLCVCGCVTVWVGMCGCEGGVFVRGWVFVGVCVCG